MAERTLTNSINHSGPSTANQRLLGSRQYTPRIDNGLGTAQKDRLLLTAESIEMAGRAGRPLHCADRPTCQRTRCLLTATEDFDRRQSFVAPNFEPEGERGGFAPFKLVGISISHTSDGLPKYLRQGSSHHTGLSIT